MPPQTFTVEQLGLSAYQVLIGNPHTDEVIDLTNILTSIQWDYDLDQACEKFTVTFVKVTDIADKIKPLNFLYILGVKISSITGIPGQLVTSSAYHAYGDVYRSHNWTAQLWNPTGPDSPHALVGNLPEYQMDKLKFGLLLEGNISTNSRGEMTATAYDVMYYLSANKSSHVLQTETATSFFTRICGMYAIPTGHVDDTEIIIGPETYLERTLYDMIVTSLALTRDIAFQKRIADSVSEDPTQYPIETRGPRFYMRTQFDKIALFKKQDPSFIWKFDSSNLYSAQSSWNATNYRNLVKVYNRGGLDSSSDDVLSAQLDSEMGDPSPLGQWPPASSMPDDDQKKYGLLSESVTLAGAQDPALNLGDNEAQAMYQAKELYVRLKKIEHGGTILAPNINSLGPGDPIYIEEPISGLVGKYYIKSGQHKVTASESTMTLTVTIEDLLPEAYKAQAEKSTSLLGGGLF